MCVTQAATGEKWLPGYSQAAPPSEPTSPAFSLCRSTAKSVLSTFCTFQCPNLLCIGLCLEASIYSELRWTVFLTSAWTSAAENIPSHPPFLPGVLNTNTFTIWFFKVLFTGRLWKISIMLLVLDVLISFNCSSGDYIVCKVKLVDRSILFRHVERIKLKHEKKWKWRVLGGCLNYCSLGNSKWIYESNYLSTLCKGSSSLFLLLKWTEFNMWCIKQWKL